MGSSVQTFSAPGGAPAQPRVLLLLPDRNTEGRGDWSGAFKVEAGRTAALYQVPPEMIVQIDVSRPRRERLDQVLAVLGRCAELDRADFYCHGWTGGIQLGASSKDAPELARALARAARPDLAVALYACSSGASPEGHPAAPGGEGGFADALRDALVAEGLTGCHVDAHTVVGHCCRNPYVRRFSSGTKLGGAWLVDPAEVAFGLWRQRLHETDLRLRYPLMSPQAIRAEVGL